MPTGRERPPRAAATSYPVVWFRRRNAGAEAEYPAWFARRGRARKAGSRDYLSLGELASKGKNGVALRRAANFGISLRFAGTGRSRAMTAAASLAALCFAAMPPAEIVLNAHLANWEKATAKANSYSGKFTMTRTTVPFGKDHIYEGRLLLMKPNLFRISIQEVHQRDTYQAFICDGKSIFIYNWSTKTATVFPLSDFE